MSGVVRAFGRTDVGRKRSSNQDQFLHGELVKTLCVGQTSLGAPQGRRISGSPRAWVLMVADGMGGHSSGNRASALVLDSIVSGMLYDLPFLEDPAQISRFHDQLALVCKGAHQRILRDAAQSPEHEGMGTTLTLAYVVWPWLYLVHVGDSRCYLYRGGQIRRLTRDHTVAAELVSQGGMRAEEAERSPWSNVLVNAMGGGGKEVVPDIERHLLEIGDKILLCSDGLNKHLADDQIAALMERHDTLDALCDALIAGANNQGGTDNITVVIGSCESDSPTLSLAEGRGGGLTVDSTVDGITKPHSIGHSPGISWTDPLETDPPDTEPHDRL